MVPIYLLTHKKADVPLWSWAALSFKIPPTSGATSTYGMAVCGNADVGMLRVGFPIAPEKFCTVDNTPFEGQKDRENASGNTGMSEG